jgi:hypothetical protein
MMMSGHVGSLLFRTQGLETAFEGLDLGFKVRLIGLELLNKFVPRRARGPSGAVSETPAIAVTVAGSATMVPVAVAGSAPVMAATHGGLFTSYIVDDITYDIKPFCTYIHGGTLARNT